MTSRYLSQQTTGGEGFITTGPGVKDDSVPSPKIAPPAFFSVPPPPLPGSTGPPPSRPGRPPFMAAGGLAPRRNAPVRSHSMSIADVNRFYGSPPLPRFRPPPPPHNQSGRDRGVEITELADSGSDNEDEVQERSKHQKPKKHFIHQHNQVFMVFFKENMSSTPT
jgi:hypothetical protein